MTDATVSHPLKEIFKAKKVALGLLTRLARSGDIARIAKTTGHDFVFMDAQHAAYNIETIAHIAQVALGIGIAPLVRVRSCDDPQTQVLLDVGATGIVFPDVNTAAEAKRAVNRARFPPVGNTPEEFGAYVKSEYIKWTKAFKELGLQAEQVR